MQTDINEALKGLNIQAKLLQEKRTAQSVLLVLHRMFTLFHLQLKDQSIYPKAYFTSATLSIQITNCIICSYLINHIVKVTIPHKPFTEELWAKAPLIRNSNGQLCKLKVYTNAAYSLIIPASLPKRDAVRGITNKEDKLLLNHLNDVYCLANSLPDMLEDRLMLVMSFVFLLKAISCYSVTTTLKTQVSVSNASIVFKSPANAHKPIMLYIPGPLLQYAHLWDCMFNSVNNNAVSMFCDE